VIEILALEVLALQAHGDTTAALGTLERALTKAEPGVMCDSSSTKDSQWRPC